MAKKKSRQTFEKMKREQAVRERRARKQERREAARIAKASVDSAGGSVDGEEAGRERRDAVAVEALFVRPGQDADGHHEQS
jgi:hypothetical protein